MADFIITNTEGPIPINIEITETSRGPAGRGVPNGGTTGQTLAKRSAEDGDTEWVSPGAASEITGLIEAGTNVTLTGAGTSASPYVINASGGGGSGTVESVAMTVPTGLSVSGSPITTTGTLAVTLSSGYVIPTQAALDAKVNTSTTVNGQSLSGNVTVTTITGNAGTATALQNARTINGVSFNGTANITVTAAAGTLSGTTLASNVVTSSLTTVGTIGTGVWQGTAIGDTYISSATTWNAKQDALVSGTNIKTINGDSVLGSGNLSISAGSVEGTAVLSTGETGGSKFLREDGDGTCSWQLITGGGDALTSSPLSQFAATTSSQLAGVISDETGTGSLVFATSPTLVTPVLGTPASGTLTNCTGLPTAGLLDEAVTFAKMAEVSPQILIGRHASGSDGAPQEVSVGNGVEFSGSGIQRSAFTGGDVTAAAGSASLTIADNAVTFAKIADLSDESKLIGRGQGAFGGDPQEISLDTATTATLKMTGSTLSVDAVEANTNSKIVIRSATGGIFASNITATGGESTFSSATITTYTEGVVVIGNSGTSQTISLTNGTFQTVTLTGNCTFTMPTATAGKSFFLKVMTGSGGFTADFTSVKWPAGTAPTITAAASKYDLISFIADGTAWSGSIIQNYSV